MMKHEKQTIGTHTLHLGDCAEILPSLGSFDLLLTDPPYGIGASAGTGKYGKMKIEAIGGDLQWDSHAPDLSAILKSETPAVVWGGNYFGLPPSRCWLVWDKGAGFKGRDFAEAELAWCSWDANVRVFSYDPIARGDYKGKQHPTQKPVALMAWCIEQCKTNPQTILDPFMGSGTTGVAAVQLGRQFVGIERERQYFDIACQRIYNAQCQSKLFGNDENMQQMQPEQVTFGFPQK